MGPHGVDRGDVPGFLDAPADNPPDDDCVDVQLGATEAHGVGGVGDNEFVSVGSERVRLVVEAGVAHLVQPFEEAAHPLQPVVVAGEFGELRVEEVEHELGCEQVLVGVGEAGTDEGTDLCDEVEIRPLR